MNLFDSPEDDKNIFDYEAGSTPEAAPPIRSDQTDRTARLATLALTEPGAVDILNKSQERLEEMRSIIATQGDAGLRKQVANEQQLRQLRTNVDMLNSAPTLDPALLPGLTQMSTDIVNADLEKKAGYALEQEALQRIEEMAVQGDELQARAILNNYIGGNAAQMSADLNTKMLILEREAGVLSAQAESDSWIGKAAHFTLGFLTLYGSTANVGNVEIDKAYETFTDNLLSGKRLNMESNSLWQIPVEDFAPFVRDKLLPRLKEKSNFLGFEDVHKQLETLSNLTRPKGIWETNAWDVVNNVGGIGAGLGLKTLTIPRILVQQGARKAAVDGLLLTATEIAENGTEAAFKATGIPTDDVVDNLLPGIINPTVASKPRYTVNVPKGERVSLKGEQVSLKGERVPLKGERKTKAPAAVAVVDEVPQTIGASSVVSLSGDLNIEMTRMAAIREALANDVRTGILTQDELAAAFEKTQARITKEYPNNLKDVQNTETVLDDGSRIPSVEFTLGAFEAEADAARFAKEHGLVPSSIVKDESGIWSFRVTEDIPETGFITRGVQTENADVVSRMLRSARNVGDRFLYGQAMTGSNLRNSMQKLVGDAYVKTFSVLSKGEREAVSQVLEASNISSKWYTRAEREIMWERQYGRLPTTRETEAYEASQELFDIDHIVRNGVMVREKTAAGYKGVSLDGYQLKLDRTNAKVTESWATSQRDRVFHLDSNTVFTKNNPLTKEIAESFRAKGEILVDLENPIRLADGTEIKSFIAKKSELQIDNVRRDQLNYKAGGHREYKGKHWLKQAVVGTHSDGEKFFKNPNVFAVAETKAQIMVIQQQMEAARLAYLADETISALDLNKLLPSHINGEDFISDMKSGVYEADTPFRYAFDRETLPEYQDGTNIYSDMRNVEESDIEAHMRTIGRMYYGGKGNVVKDWQGSRATLLDPFNAIENALKNVSSLSSLADYKISATERWLKTFKPHLVGGNDLSAFEAIRSGTFKAGTSKEIVDAGIAQREVIERTLNWRTQFDREMEVYQRGFNDFVVGKDVNSAQHKLGAKALDWANNVDPVAAMKNFAFDLKLGLFNPNQFPLQIGTMIASMSVAGPKLGAQAFGNLYFTRLYITKSGTDAMLDQFIKRGAHTITGLDANEYKLMMKQAKDSGFLTSVHMSTADFGLDINASAFGSNSAVRKAGRVFINEGEVWNRSVAWRIAWGEARTRYPELLPTSGEFKARLQQLADDYSFNMTPQAAAAWQKGLLSIPTQFWAYNARMLEAMLGDTFTAAQKRNLIVGQALFYGSAGIPVAPAISEMVKNMHHQGKLDSPEMVRDFGKFVDRGMVDTLYNSMTGGDSLIGARFGTGAFISDTIKNLFGMSKYGESSFADIMGGATGSIAVAGFETVTDVLKYAVAESGGDIGRPLTRESFVRLAANISTVSNGLKAYMIYNYGTLISTKGNVMATDVPKADAFAVLLFGAQPSETELISQHFNYLKDKGKAGKEAGKVLSNYRMLMQVNPGNRREYEEELNGFIRTLSPEIRAEAYRNANMNTSQSTLDGVTQQVEKDRTRQYIQESMEGTDASN